MELKVFVFLSFFVLFVNGQESLFELPVQLVGFPFIVGSVKLTNFLKKLSYSLSPATYRSRNRRALTFASDTSEPFDAQEVEKYIIGEFGAKACVFERVCAHYATRARTLPKPQMDWPDVFSQYKRSTDQGKEMYLLSVFLGDIVGSTQLCHQLGKRKGCDERLLGLNPVFAKSQRGNPVIMIGQYRFNRVNKYGSRIRWVCVKAKAGCRASLQTMDNAIVRVLGCHNPLAHTSANRF